MGKVSNQQTDELTNMHRKGTILSINMVELSKELQASPTEHIREVTKNRLSC